MHRAAWSLCVLLAVTAAGAISADAAELADLVVVACSEADGRVVVREGAAAPVAKRVGDTLLDGRYVIRGVFSDAVSLDEKAGSARSDGKRVTPPAAEVRVYVAGADGHSRVQRFERVPPDAPRTKVQIARPAGESTPRPPTDKRPQTKP